MESRITIEVATRQDAAELAETMRDDDVAEIQAMSGREPYAVLLSGIDESEQCWCVRYDGELMAMYGVVGAIEAPSTMGVRLGCAWLLTSTVVDRAPKAFWEVCKSELAVLLSQWDMLVNWVDCRHEKAIRWGKRLGFAFDEPAPFGINGMDFQRFTVTLDDLGFGRYGHV